MLVLIFFDSYAISIIVSKQLGELSIVRSQWQPSGFKRTTYIQMNTGAC